MKERTELIHDIRARLPFVAVGHPELAEQIERAMDIVEAEPKRELDERQRLLALWPELRRLADITATETRVGTVVRGFESGRTWLGIVVQVGDEDDHPGRVLVYKGDEYPGWWADWVVVPLAALKSEPSR